jgi:integrase
VLLGCALRRAELVELGVEQIQQRDRRWQLRTSLAKAGRVRMVPVLAWAMTDELCESSTDGAQFDAAESY